MPLRRNHLTDEQLLRFAEFELPRRQAYAIRDHLNHCAPCSQRLRILETSLADAIAAHEAQIQELPHDVPFQASDARARFLHRLRQEISAARPQRPSAQRFSFPALAGAALFLAFIAASAWLVTTRYSAARFPVDTVANLPLPSRALTPGSLRTASEAAVCRDTGLQNDPPVSPSTRDAVFDRYAVPSASRSSYAMDYLIAPSLGGADNANNIWPEPATSAWNAADKDRLEDHLHTLVCTGQLPLVIAQKEMATDWIAAYKKYFHTDKPASVESARMWQPSIDTITATKRS